VCWGGALIPSPLCPLDATQIDGTQSMDTVFNSIVKAIDGCKQALAA